MAPLMGAGMKKVVSDRDWHATEWITWRSTQSVGGGSASSNLRSYIKQSPCQRQIFAPISK